MPTKIMGSIHVDLELKQKHTVVVEPIAISAKFAMCLKQGQVEVAMAAAEKPGPVQQVPARWSRQCPMR